MNVSVGVMSVYLTIFRVSVLVALILPLDADNGCEIEIKVRRHTVYEASLGQQLKIACNVSVCDNLPPPITWFKFETDFRKVNLSGRIKTEWTSTNNTEGIYFLIFNNILSSDSGRYRCHSPNEVSHDIDVTVITDKDLCEMKLYKASSGDELWIACPVQFCDGIAPEVTWFKVENNDPRSVNLSNRVSTQWNIFNKAGGIHFLIFQNVFKRDSGLYQCRSGNQVRHNFSVSVVCESVVKVQRNSMYNVTNGDPLKISCPVKVCDNILPAVSWFKDETQGLVRVNTSDRVTTKWAQINEYEAIHFLIIHKVLSSDSGFYQCQSDSSASHFIAVFVTAVSDPPSNSYFINCLYRLVGTIVFFIIVASVYVFLKKRKDAARSKTVAKKGFNVRRPNSPHREHGALSLQTDHIYEDVL